MTPVLVDTSVWRRYFDGAPAMRALGELLDEDGVVLVHPFVVGEMVLWGLSATEEALFTRLPGAPFVPHEEVLAFVRRRRLARRGIGGGDAHLWMLRWLGHDAVAVLDGGWPRWRSEERAVSSHGESRPARAFAPRPRADLLITTAEIESRMQDAGIQAFRLAHRRTLSW